MCLEKCCDDVPDFQDRRLSVKWFLAAFDRSSKALVDEWPLFGERLRGLPGCRAAGSSIRWGVSAGFNEIASKPSGVA